MRLRRHARLQPVAVAAVAAQARGSAGAGEAPAHSDGLDGPALARMQRLERVAGAIATLSEDPDYPTPPEQGVVMGKAGFRSIGRDFLDHFVAFADLDPDADVLDAGCGGGRMAACLSYYLRNGSYVGFDVHADSIEWCRRAIASGNPRFRFDHVDLHNPIYNPDGRDDAATHRFPYPDGQFDFIIATSLITHMFRSETANYLSEFARVLRPGGAAFVTAFLINADSVMAMTREARSVKFPEAFRDSLVLDGERPAAGVAHPEEWLLADARGCGLGLDRVAYGAWTAQTRLSKQDILLFRRDR
jgi:SAM-dependent methyltransferase